MDEFTHIGLDVHKDTIAVAVLRSGTTTCDERVIPNTPEAMRKLLARFPDQAALRTCYEAGPTGYDTHRLISSLGIACEVIAPSLIPRRSGMRVKTDRIDARNLARLQRAGELTAVRVPTPAEEALRDLVRAREDLKERPPHRQAEDQELPAALRQALPESRRPVELPCRGLDARPALRRTRVAGRLRPPGQRLLGQG